MIERDAILEAVRAHRSDSISVKQLAARCGLPRTQREALGQVLEELQLEGLLVELSPGRWAVPDRVGMTVGRLERKPKGFGFVIPIAAEEEDVHVPGRGMDGAVHRDIVLVRHEKPGSEARKRGLGPTGEIVRVLKRANQRLIGTLRARGRQGLVEPDDPAILRRVFVPRTQQAGAKLGEKVLVEISSWPSGPKADLAGRVAEVLGREGEPGVDERSVIIQFGLPEEFPRPAVQEGARIPRAPSAEEIAGRRDFRDCVTITIDPETARDRDDGLSFRRNPRTGNREVLVHITDVAHYVRPGTALDQAARERGLSVYLVSDFIPMLPLEPTQQALSLAEDTDRLTKTVSLQFDDEGRPVDSSLSRAVVNTDAALTYAEVKQMLDAADAEDETAAAREMAKWQPEVWEAVIQLDRLARQLRRQRRERGSVDLDVPDYDVRVDEEGKVSAVWQIERDRSHDLVEEFMLSANCAVARFLQEHNLPGIYRTHEEPEEKDLEAFATFVHTVMGRKTDPHDRGQLQDLLNEVSGTNLSEAVNMELLRCMQRAIYQAEPAPHFALHFPLYCHFTSPIRRYPDLVVHQILDQHLDGKAAAHGQSWASVLPSVAKHCTETEQRADKAEREIVKIKLLRFLKGRGGPHGEVFHAVVTGVLEFGLFAQLIKYSVEGLIPVASLKDDYYVFDEVRRALVGKRKGRVLQLGQSVKVLIDDIDLSRREMDLKLAR